MDLISYFHYIIIFRNFNETFTSLLTTISVSLSIIEWSPPPNDPNIFAQKKGRKIRPTSVATLFGKKRVVSNNRVIESRFRTFDISRFRTFSTRKLRETSFLRCRVTQDRVVRVRNVLHFETFVFGHSTLQLCDGSFGRHFGRNFFGKMTGRCFGFFLFFFFFYFFFFWFRFFKRKRKFRKKNLFYCSGHIWYFFRPFSG